MKNCYLYKVANLINNKSYIGISSKPSSRKWQHLNGKVEEGVWSSLVARAVNKYGKENFEFKVLCVGSKKYIADLENKAILSYKTAVPDGYNIKPGGIEDYSGYRVTGRLTDVPLYSRGFWFPNLRTCAEKLNVDKTTVLRWRKENNLASEKNIRKLREDSLESPCYVGGFWFPTMSIAVTSLNVTRPTLQKRITAGYVEQQNNKSMVRGENHPCAIKISVDGIVYNSILEASKFSGYTYRVIDYRLKTNKEGFCLVE